MRDGAMIGLILDRLEVKTADILAADFWRLLPVINVDRTEDIPRDWPGLMGVPITYLPKDGRGPNGRLEMMDLGNHPRVEGLELYKRVIVRDRRPDLPEYMDLADWAKQNLNMRLAVTLVPMDPTQGEIENAKDREAKERIQ